MNSVVMELTGREKEILDEAAAKVEEEMACLSVYTVNAHFSDQATETTEGKVKHILSKNITL